MDQAPSVNWVVSHKFLPKLMCGDPQGMDPRLKPTLAQADEVVGNIWRAAQEMVGPAPLPIPPTCARVRVGGRDTIAFCFVALQANDSHYALAAPTPAGWRYLTFEKPMLGEGAVLGEWADDKHTNWGMMPPPVNLAAFLAHCEPVLGVGVELVEGPRTVSLTGTLSGSSHARREGYRMALLGVGVLALLAGIAWFAL